MMNELSGKILAAVLLLCVLAFGCTTSKNEPDVQVSSDVPGPLLAAHIQLLNLTVPR